ncbi:MAG TPA: pyridoxamine 5'-phosphate oxidase family protein [Noviherbaspirillum sp.]|jgi:hypothetical protein|uniref:pyridoxamine 5'-phosphate oxidase family protein n=1 Tax=Noviherbaspirillum sp. TaxID=1926288 RepID=UPI002DDD38FF|nr:pyridoxamine 5'-phosphate oxidase family protein [Noviherbaspirillum sp.]HEV2612201.1 pyridoxamine 5'-phosphate oxidase family protein [Noviherbaspirillum sp.]
MRHSDPTFDIADPASLEALFGTPGEASIAKEIGHIDANYRALIEASPFVALATAGPGGLDCSPRGDGPGFVRVLDENTLLLPERRGNNRIDSLRNLLDDPRVALLFLIPGVGETLRVNGRATISADPALLKQHEVDGKAPKVVLLISVDSVFFQCSRAVVRADLWNPERHADRSALPTPGQILDSLTASAINREQYDRELPGRVKATLY